MEGNMHEKIIGAGVAHLFIERMKLEGWLPIKEYFKMEKLGIEQIKVSDVLKAITDYKPIFGHRTTIKNQTIWMAFIK